MGILTKAELQEIRDRILDNYSGINFIPVMKKGRDMIWLDRLNNIVFFLENNDFASCFKKQSKDDFKNSVDELKNEEWNFIS